MVKNMAINFDFSSLTEDDTLFLRGLRATFVMAPRKLSQIRLTQLSKELLAKGNVIFCIAEERYVQGFEGQDQFEMQPMEPILEIAKSIKDAKLGRGLYILKYKQGETDEAIRATRPNNVVVVRGSYRYVFHRSETFSLLEKRGIPFRYVSPFVDEEEAKDFLRATAPEPLDLPGGLLADEDVFQIVDEVAKNSYDYSFQTGAVLAEQTGQKYMILDAACNEVVPYQTYALHHGNAREDSQVGLQDISAYDTIHAEMNLLVRATKTGLNFEGKTLFINLMPCPTCARNLVVSGLRELAYRKEHSGGYAIRLFEKAGIKTRKVEK